MPIDAKYLKPKSDGALITRTFVAPKHVLEYLQARGVNVSAVCRDALENALATGVPIEPEVKQYSFKASKGLIDQINKQGINLSETCVRALEAVFLELKGDAKRLRR